MRDVEVSINRRPFRIACEEEQEPRLRALAKYVDHEVQGLAEQFGQIGDDRLLVMVALLLADRLDEASSGSSGPPTNIAPAGVGNGMDEDEAAELFNLLAERLERMAAQLEQASG